MHKNNAQCPHMWTQVLQKICNPKWKVLNLYIAINKQTATQTNTISIYEGLMKLNIISKNILLISTFAHFQNQKCAQNNNKPHGLGCDLRFKFMQNHKFECCSFI